VSDTDDEAWDVEDVAMDETSWQLFWAQEHKDTLQVGLKYTCQQCPGWLLSEVTSQQLE
jgi:hypothetical protein